MTLQERSPQSHPCVRLVASPAWAGLIGTELRPLTARLRELEVLTAIAGRERDPARLAALHRHADRETDLVGLPPIELRGRREADAKAKAS